MRLFWRFAFVLGLACGGATQSAGEPIADAFRGTYGRTAQDLAYGTRGLEIGVDTLRLSEMTITIRQGKVVGEDYQVAMADVAWDRRVDKAPAECKGTIARQDDHLLLRLFDASGDKPCEPILEGDWRVWRSATEFPPGLRGWYGVAERYSRPVGFQVGETIITETNGATFELVDGMVWQGDDTAIAVREGLDDGVRCRGIIRVVEGVLDTSLEPIDPDTFGCQTLHGQRWVVDETRLPKTRLTNGEATLHIVDRVAKISGPGPSPMTCTQRILRTTDRGTTDREQDDIPVLSGVVVALEPSRPEGDLGRCKQGLARLAVADCKRRSEESCDEASVLAQAQIEPRCPTHVVIGDPEPEGHRVGLMPIFDPVNLVCLGFVGRFAPVK